MVQCGAFDEYGAVCMICARMNCIILVAEYSPCVCVFCVVQFDFLMRRQMYL